MDNTVKKIIKTAAVVIGVFLLLAGLLLGGLIYEMNYKRTDVLNRESPDGQLVLKMQQIGEPAWPFGPVNGRFELKASGKVINSLKFTVYDDGAGLEFNVPAFTWEEDCVKITVSGSEQDDMLYTLYYDGESSCEKAEEDSEALTDISPEVLNYYMSIEPACSFVMADGLEYRLVAVDRALGSSFYVLVGTYDGTNCDFVNPDPFNGSGGEARWLEFVDGELGFTCLAKSGGSYGYLYCTRDGGNSFTMLTYPEAEVVLSNGTSYNPFVMPETVYEKDGLLYLEVGQGADGDYYGKEGFCHGLYKSGDRGETWEFVGEIPAARE